MAQVKQPKTYKDQVSLLKAKGVIIENDKKCENFLKKSNYYRFSAYLLPFRDITIKKCLRPLSFDRVVDIYNFDKELRHLISRLIESVEIELRTKIAYYHSHKYGSLGYCNTQNYNKGHDHKKFKKNCKECIKENKTSPVVLHHQQKYNGQFPLWVIIEYFHLGMLSHFYTDLQACDQKAIAKEYKTSHLNLLSWFKCLNDLRNRCAHYSRLYYWVYTSVPKQDRTCSYTPDQTLFSQVLMLKMLSINLPEWKKSFLPGLKRAIKKYANSIELSHIGFPSNWEELLSK